MNTQDKVIFKHSKNDKNKTVFEVIKINGCFVMIKPGAYGQENMIVSKGDIQVIKG